MPPHRRNIPPEILSGLKALRQHPDSDQLETAVANVIKSALAVAYNEGALDSLATLGLKPRTNL